jgi:DNA-binding MarR family transcriptional regulator
MERAPYSAYWPRPRSTHLLEPLGNLAIHCLTRAARRVSARLADEFAWYDLRLSDVEALREMCKSVCTSPTALARALGMSKGGISKMLVRLERDLWITKTVDSTDRRCRVLTLTAGGKDLIRSLAEMEEDVDREAFGVLGKKMWSDLPRALLHVGRKKLPSIAVAGPEVTAMTAPQSPSAPGTGRATSHGPKRAVLGSFAKFC